MEVAAAIAIPYGPAKKLPKALPVPREAPNYFIEPASIKPEVALPVTAIIFSKPVAFSLDKV
jgi:hypothetical protein